MTKSSARACRMRELTDLEVAFRDTRPLYEMHLVPNWSLRTVSVPYSLTKNPVTSSLSLPTRPTLGLPLAPKAIKSQPDSQKPNVKIRMLSRQLRNHIHPTFELGLQARQTLQDRIELSS